MAEGRTTLEVCRFKDKEGHYRWLHEEQKLITHTDGTLEVVGAWWDITDRKKVEEELRKSEALTRSIVNIVPDIIFKFDRSGKYLDIIPPEDKNLYLPKEEMLGQTISSILPEEPADICMNTIEKALLTNTMQTCEYELTVPAGTLYFEARIMPADDNIVYAFVRDITELKQAEQALNYQFQFEKMVSEISTCFVRLPSQDTERGINLALKLTGEFFGVDRSYILQLSPCRKRISNTHEWCREGVQPHISEFQDFPMGNLPWLERKVSNQDYVLITGLEHLPPEAEAEKSLLNSLGNSLGIKSILCLPIEIDGEPFGFFGFDTSQGELKLTQAEITLLYMVGELVSSALSKQKIEEKIRHLSFYDQLTGLYNRDIMDIWLIGNINAHSFVPKEYWETLVLGH